MNTRITQRITALLALLASVFAGLISLTIHAAPAGALGAANAAVAVAGTATGNGYTLVASDGGIFNFGDSKFYGSMGGKPLAKPIVGGSMTPTGKGYTLVASEGGIFNFGDSRFYGSMGGKPLNQPIVGMTSTPTGNGYTLVSSDGGIFNFGDSRFYGSAANIGVDHAQPGDLITFEQLRAIYGAQVGDTQAVRDGVPTLAREMYSAGIRTARQKAAFLATILNESGFRYNALQGGTSIYRGRGFIQLTGSSNYSSAGAALGAPMSSSPDLARSLTWSAPIATWYWMGRTYSRTHANQWAERLDMGRVDAIIGYARSSAEDAERCSAFRNALRYFTGEIPAGINCTRP